MCFKFICELCCDLCLLLNDLSEEQGLNCCNERQCFPTALIHGIVPSQVFVFICLQLSLYASTEIYTHA